MCTNFCWAFRYFDHFSYKSEMEESYHEAYDFHGMIGKYFDMENLHSFSTLILFYGQCFTCLSFLSCGD